MGLGLTGKVALVTGGSRGIGAAAAKRLAAGGAAVIINYLKNGEKAEEVLEEVRRAGGRGMAIRADVRVTEEVERMAEEGLSEFGSIDILVNNANIHFPVKPFVSLSWEEIETKITDELKALYNCSQAVLKDMVKRKSGRLIFVSSGLSRYPAYGFSAHAGAKAAMDAMARVMAYELGPSGITVNVVGPGLIKTDATAGFDAAQLKTVSDMTPLRRNGEPDDVAGIIAYLASPLADFVTGQYIHVNGGIFMN
ncbi:MAG TPA: SDR family oxidoreductase [Thermodesulfobacteriota bacterium]|nr:SDR family oxidoreductase [Thermodesulfobacteriota bacterium]